jgi:DNA-directed RNA polymerase
MVGETTEEIVTSAKTAMDWLKAVAALPTIFNYYGWISPIGFHVNHMYHKTQRKKVRVTPLGGTEIEMTYRERKSHVNHKKMEDALPPNYVHSLDASHLMMTVLKCKKAGIETFGMVHDSYASHAANIPLTLKLLKEAFVELHKRDVLAEFREQIASGIETEEAVGEEEVTTDWGDGMVSTYSAQKYEPVDGEEYLQEIESKLKEPLERGELDINEVLKSTYFFA